MRDPVETRLIRALDSEILRMQVRLEQTELRANVAREMADTIRGEIAVLTERVDTMRAERRAEIASWGAFRTESQASEPNSVQPDGRSSSDNNANNAADGGCK